MKTTFSYFPGMFEIPAPVKYYFKKTKSKILWNINFIRMLTTFVFFYIIPNFDPERKVKKIGNNKWTEDTS